MKSVREEEDISLFSKMFDFFYHERHENCLDLFFTTKGTKDTKTALTFFYHERHENCFDLFLTLSLHRCFHQAHKQRMRIFDGTFQLRVKLNADKIRMLFQFHDFYQTRVRINAGRFKTRRLELLFVGVVELIAVAVSLADGCFFIDFMRQ